MIPETFSLANLLYVLAVPIATLVGVWITQRNSRKTKQMVEANRRLKLIELERRVSPGRATVSQRRCFDEPWFLYPWHSRYSPTFNIVWDLKDL